MLKMNVKVSEAPEVVLKKAVEFFGPGGNGLKISEQNDCCVYFEGGGGGVGVMTKREEKGTSVDLETREWEYLLKEFAQIIKK